jgi:hypothetical protein
MVTLNFKISHNNFLNVLIEIGYEVLYFYKMKKK